MSECPWVHGSLIQPPTMDTWDGVVTRTTDQERSPEEIEARAAKREASRERERKAKRMRNRKDWNENREKRLAYQREWYRRRKEAEQKAWEARLGQIVIQDAPEIGRNLDRPVD